MTRQLPPRKRRVGRSLRRLVMALFITVVIPGCMGRGSGPADPFKPGGAAGGRLTVEVQNQNFNDIRVFAFKRGQRIRVGDVTGKTDKKFTLDWDFAVPIQFRVEVVSGRTCTVPTLLVDPGSEIWLRIPTDMGLGQCRASRR